MQDQLISRFGQQSKQKKFEMSKNDNRKGLQIQLRVRVRQMSHLRLKIKSCLQSITQSLKQIPQDKQVIIATRVNKVLQKYTGQQSPQSLQKFNKELEFNLNFIKLSYPNINFNFQQTSKSQTDSPSQTTSSKEEAMNDIKTFQHFFEIANAESLKKQMKDISGIREQVQFSNWSEGNLDPQNLKRHKQLLTRQHFGGQFWKGKQRPKMQSAEMIASFIQNTKMQPPKVTQKTLQKKQKTFVSDPEKAFEKVNRL